MPWCYQTGDRYNEKECEEDYMCNRHGGVTNVYVGGTTEKPAGETNPSSSKWSCRKRERECVQPTVQKTRDGNAFPKDSKLPPEKQKECKEPTDPPTTFDSGGWTKVERPADGSHPNPNFVPRGEISNPVPEKEPDLNILESEPDLNILESDFGGILETQVEGFEEELGEQTFEEINNNNDPGPFLGPTVDTAAAETTEQENSESTLPPPPVPPPPPVVASKDYYVGFTITSAPTQQSMVSSTVTISSAAAASQDPDGITWLDPSLWASSTWDGTPIDVFGSTPTNEQLCDFLSPSHPYIMKGLRERFYEVNPFSDNENPTIAEINAWDLEQIRHFRCLLGVTTPVWPDARLYLEARWADERKNTNAWDVSYPDTNTCGGGSCNGKSPGPCFGFPDLAGGHCGGSFWPVELDRQAYIQAPPYNNDVVSYPELGAYSNRRSKAEGIIAHNAGMPWSIKMSVMILQFACSEGLSGHAGPFVGDSNATGGTQDRTFFGSSWWHEPGSGSISMRGKWASQQDFDPGPEISNCR
jgi:hypothetical protein